MLLVGEVKSRLVQWNAPNLQLLAKLPARLHVYIHVYIYFPGRRFGHVSSVVIEREKLHSSDVGNKNHVRLYSRDTSSALLATEVKYSEIAATERRIVSVEELLTQLVDTLVHSPQSKPSLNVAVCSSSST